MCYNKFRNMMHKRNTVKYSESVNKVTNPIYSVDTNPIYSIDQYCMENFKHFSDLEWRNLLKKNLLYSDFIYLIKIRLTINKYKKIN